MAHSREYGSLDWPENLNLQLFCIERTCQPNSLAQEAALSGVPRSTMTGESARVAGVSLLENEVPTEATGAAALSVANAIEILATEIISTSRRILAPH